MHSKQKKCSHPFTFASSGTVGGQRQIQHCPFGFSGGEDTLRFDPDDFFAVGVAEDALRLVALVVAFAEVEVESAAAAV